MACGPRVDPVPAATPPTPAETLKALQNGDLTTARIGLEYGITVDPLNADLYLELTRIYAFSTQPLWALLYGEAFLLLEPYTPRAAEVSMLMVAVHQRLAREAPRTSQDPFEAALTEAAARALNTSGGRVDLAGIVAWRLALPQAHTLDDPILHWHRRLQEAGHLEAYTWWLLRAGDPSTFAAWVAEHQAELIALRDFLNTEAFQPGRDGLVGRPAHER